MDHKIGCSKSLSITPTSNPLQKFTISISSGKHLQNYNIYFKAHNVPGHAMLHLTNTVAMYKRQDVLCTCANPPAPT